MNGVGPSSTYVFYLREWVELDVISGIAAFSSFYFSGVNSVFSDDSGFCLSARPPGWRITVSCCSRRPLG